MTTFAGETITHRRNPGVRKGATASEGDNARDSEYSDSRSGVKPNEGATYAHVRSPMWETLETYARGGIQQFIQRVLALAQEAADVRVVPPSTCVVQARDIVVQHPLETEAERGATLPWRVRVRARARSRIAASGGSGGQA